MLTGIQIHITLDIEFIPLAEVLEISREECVRQWQEGELEETIAEHMEVQEVVELCEAKDAYCGVRVGSGYH